MKSLLTSPVIALLLTLLSYSTEAAASQPIGEVGGQAIYRSAVEGKSGVELEAAMRKLFVDVVVVEHLKANKAELMPSDSDIALVSAQLKADALRRPENAYARSMDENQVRFVAAFILANITVQRYIHRRFGGGRLLFQQAGVEAFDATRVMVETLEKQGKFKVFDPRLRAAMYAYWNRDHGAFLITDKRQIEKALHPSYLGAQKP